MCTVSQKFAEILTSVTSEQRCNFSDIQSFHSSISHEFDSRLLRLHEDDSEAVNWLITMVTTSLVK